MNIEKQIKGHAAQTIQLFDAGQVGQREVAEALELLAQLNDYYTELQESIEDGSLKSDYSVTVKAEGNTIKFSNIDQVAEWMTNDKLFR